MKPSFILFFTVCLEQFIILLASASESNGLSRILIKYSILISPILFHRSFVVKYYEYREMLSEYERKEFSYLILVTGVVYAGG